MATKIQYSCPKCGGEIILQDAYVDLNSGETSTYDNIVCGDCSAEKLKPIETQVPAGPKTFMAFCQESNGTGTTWIDSVEAEDIEDAKVKALAKCARDWSYDDDLVDDIHLLGLIEGDAKVVHWEDICDRD